MKRILLTGKNGQIGWELEKSLASLGHVIACDRNTLDLADSHSIIKVIRDIKPDIIVNAAAYTAVDKAEEEPALAIQVNGTAPGILAEEAKRLGAILVHYSTDYVFDGTASTPYAEEDLPNPLNVYGKSKLVGENAINDVGGKFLIFRTSWVYGSRGKNFLLTMLRLAQERKNPLKIVNDQVGAPTWCRPIAQTTADILKKCISGDLEMISGIYHLTSSGQTSWCGFAESILKKHPLSPTVIGIPSTDYKTPAKRPPYSVLSNAKIQRTFSVQLPPWQIALHDVLGTVFS